MNATSIIIICLVASVIAVYILVRKYNQSKKSFSTLKYLYIRETDKLKAENDTLSTSFNEANNKLLSQHIFQSLSQMDKVFKYYTDENEANRELCVCLNLLGHNAVYQPTLNNRSIDVYLDNIVTNNDMVIQK